MSFRAGAAAVGLRKLGGSGLRNKAFPQGSKLFFVKCRLGRRKCLLLSPVSFSGNQFRQVRQRIHGMEMVEVCLNLSGPHQVNAGEQDTKGVEQWFNSGLGFLQEEPPLVLRKAEVMMRMVSGKAFYGYCLQFLVLRALSGPLLAIAAVRARIR